MSHTETKSPGLAALGDIFLQVGKSQTDEFPGTECDALVIESDRLLKIIGKHTPTSVADTAALALAKVILASSSLRDSAAARNAAVAQSERARAGKKWRTDRRWRSIRCAIVWVCTKQKLRLIASDAFAASVRKDVIEAAKRFGLDDIRMGTSSRSIERHIAALLKDRKLLSAILVECELQGLW